MRRQHERDLEILTAIDEGGALTQRALAQRLGVALGLANLYVKRLARKGCIKIVEFPRKPAARKRLRYLLTPRGMSEKTRLTYEHMTYSLGLFRRARQTLRASLAELPELGAKRIALVGAGEAAEVAWLTLRELHLEPLAVFTREGGGQFLGLPVRPLGELRPEDFDAAIVASFDRPEPMRAELEALGLPSGRVLSLRRPLLAAGESGA